MKSLSVFGAMLALTFPLHAAPPDPSDASLPEGVRVVWDIRKAHRETTPTRERICLNGLWRWQPADAQLKQVPAGNWGYFKVPGCWPGITDYMQKDSQTLYSHPAWKDQKLGNVMAAWYQREFTVPANWDGRRVTVSADCLNSHATVFVDGRSAGEIWFPAGEVDLTGAFQPGRTHLLSLLVVAMPLKAVAISYTDTASAVTKEGSVARRGLCGDVFLVSKPRGPRAHDVKVDTSVRRREISIGAVLENPAADAGYILHARIMDGGRTVREFSSRAFQASDLKDGRMEFTEKWMPEKLWDTHTPQNTHALEISLMDVSGKALDVYWTTRFGYREFWIDGRDFFLNGTRIHLSAVPLDNAQVSAATATYGAAKESFERLKSFGINFVYTHNYDCEPGAHLGFEEILRAADDAGMLIALTQPHFSGYDWKAADADANNGYARHAAFYARAARDHPSVVMYSMSHNATGYEEDMNPDMIDGLHDPRDEWSARNATLALRAEAIVKRLDPGRIVYHHASGNLGSMHPMNFYPNMVPIQELSDWFEHWATKGVKPAFMCEYGAPFTWDWTMYRGWYKGQREFGSAKVPWEFCLAEWNAQFIGDHAYRISEAEKANLRWEAKQFRAGNLWHRWDYPNDVGSPRFEERYPIFTMYLTDNWRAFRTWGVSAISPWEYGHFWILPNGVKKGRKEFKIDWENLQRPGFSPDYDGQQFERMDMAFRLTDWSRTEAAQALVENNRPLLAYLGGKPDHFTSKDHNFLAGETIEKQLIVINDSRETITCDCQWAFGLTQSIAAATVAGTKEVTVAPGQQERTPVRVVLPGTAAPGRYDLSTVFTFNRGDTRREVFKIDVLPPAAPLKIETKIALFDPKGETRKLLDEIGVPTQPVEAGANLSPYDILIVGKAALTANGEAPDISRVRDGLKVIMFEQTADVLEKRFGFRIAEYGLRQVFPRIPGHPVLAGLRTENLHDWRGDATILPPRLTYELRPRYGPTVQWCGLPVPRLWRCGNRGSVASVLIEKPARGDFLSILDGGFGLQYSTLMEYREGRGVVLFCQTDVTGRTEAEPAAATLARNLLEYVANWKPIPRRKAFYIGEAAGKGHLEAAGITVSDYDGGKLSPGEVLIAGPGGGRSLSGRAGNVAGWLKAGGGLLAVGFDQSDADALLPIKVSIRSAEHISAWFESPPYNSLLSGIGPADVHNRDPRELPLVTTEAQLVRDGVIAKKENINVVFCQMVPWQFDPSRQSNLKRTYRRAAVLLSRLMGNLGVAGSTPVLERFHRPANAAEKRWLEGLYFDQPEEWDDPYRFFRW